MQEASGGRAHGYVVGYRVVQERIFYVPIPNLEQLEGSDVGMVYSIEISVHKPLLFIFFHSQDTQVSHLSLHSSRERLNLQARHSTCP